MICEPCNGTGVGWMMYPDRKPDAVPCWHCDGTGNAEGDQVMQEHNQAPPAPAPVKAGEG